MAGNLHIRTVLAVIALLLIPAQIPVTGSDLTGVRINLLNGSSIRGTIDAIDESGVLTGEGIPDGLTIDQVVSIQTRRDVAFSPAGAVVQLAGGSRISASDVEIADDMVRFQSQCGLSETKLENLRAVVWIDSDLVSSRIESPSVDMDIVIVQSSNGFRAVEGLLESVTASKVAVNFRGESRTISMEKVQGVVVADLKLDSPEGTTARIMMTDGSLLIGTLGQLSQDNRLTLYLPGNNELLVDTAGVSEIKIQSANLVYASDMQPVEVEQRSSFAVERDWQRDVSVEGNPLTLGLSGSGRTVRFDKGLGTSAYTRLVYDNSDEFTRFRAMVGIDVETGGRGDCVASVVGDGIQLWSGRVRADENPVPVSVDISGLQRIELIVEPGEQFDLADHLNWCDARFTRTTGR